MKIPGLRKHKTGQGFVRIRGVNYYCGKYGEPDTQTKYELYIAEYLASKHSFTAQKSRSKLVEDLVVSFLEYLEEYSDRRDIANARLVTQVALNLYRTLPAHLFGPIHFKTIRSQFAAGGIRKKRSRQYINKSMSILIRMFGWCAGEGLVPASVVATLREIDPLRIGRTDAPETEDVDSVDASIVDATIPHLPTVVADMVRLQQLIGCRPGELCSIRPSMIDRSRDIWVIRLPKHKNAWRNKIREIFIGPRAQEILCKYLYRPFDGPCFSPRDAMRQRRKKRSTERVTPLNEGNRPGYGDSSRAGETGPRYSSGYTTATYGKAIAYACKLAWPAPEGMNETQQREWHAKHRWSPNQLRHSAACEIRDSHSLEHVAAVLGHSDVNTSKIYAKLRRNVKGEEAARNR